MTLVEVVAGLALLATLMASLLAVKTRVVHQAGLTERRAQAVAAADQLLSEWWRNPKTFPRASAGMLPSGFGWRTRIVNNSPEVGGQVVRLEMFDGPDIAPTVAVELLLPTWSQ